MGKEKYQSESPLSLKLGDLKRVLRMEASENERSLHYWAKKILTRYATENKLFERYPKQP